jgi:hypothetical protein
MGSQASSIANPGKNTGLKISAIRPLAGIDNFPVKLAGDTLDHGGIQAGVEARVAGLLPLATLAMCAVRWDFGIRLASMA